MCGIVAVLARRRQAATPGLADLHQALHLACERIPPSMSGTSSLTHELCGSAERLAEVDRALRHPAEWRHAVQDAGFRGQLQQLCRVGQERLKALEEGLDSQRAAGVPEDLERLNEVLIQCKDALWAVERDRLGAAREVAVLAGGSSQASTIDAFSSVRMVLSALDRLEVRGRDSAGIHLYLTGHGLDPEAPEVQELLRPRVKNRLFSSGAVRLPEGSSDRAIAIVYKAAAEIGELGDNGRVLRHGLQEDPLLHLALSHPEAEVRVLGHTRWASVGLINQVNAHPLNHEEEGHWEEDGEKGPYVVAALNGDVDNYADLIATAGLRIASEITTDAKVIPVLLSRRLGQGLAVEEAFVDTVSSFVGSVAIAAMSSADPDKLLLAQRGSGQALYVGLAEDAFLVASEPYGLVEQTATYLRVDGETPGNPANPDGSRGQVLVLDRSRAGTLEGIRRLAYDGTPLPVDPQELRRAEITTRDVDRGSYPHYLLKEISESPDSFRKTLRGRIREENGELVTRLSPESLPASLGDALQDGSIRRVVTVGQGTAAVAARGVAAALRGVLDAAGPGEAKGALSRHGVSSGWGALPLSVEATLAAELSGFGLREKMSDTLLIAVSQSGTTTDTNRTVDLVRSRGARVLSIVNRRHSDLTEKSDGVLYTSDGRDVEMSVASTKAFYSQLAAGFLLAFTLAEKVHDGAPASRASRTKLLKGLRDLPAAMEEVVAQREHIADIARRFAPRHRYWAVVGNGTNRIAAEEIRIKLSELCYKAIACDTTEDKKHIDLSSEPLILVCAAGLSGSTADDVAKEVAIYRAHKATPIVIATEGEQRFTAAVDLISVPRTHPSLAYVLTTMVGHLFGYEAALAIDRLARPLREIRAAVESLVSSLEPGADLLQALRPKIHGSVGEFFRGVRERAYDGQLEASTAVHLASLIKYVEAHTPLESYRAEYGKSGAPGVLVEDLTEALTRAIEELTRPVDAIKHQAKTVTVGISRTDEALLTVPVVRELMAVGMDRDRIRYADLQTLAALDPAVDKVLGYTRYLLDGDPEDDLCAIQVVDHGGISRALRSRTETQPILKGTKRMVALERRLLAARGRSDDRTFILVPELEGNRVAGLTLLHVAFRDRLEAPIVRGVLAGYRNRYAALRDAVMETEPSFREDLLESLSPADLLTESIRVLAESWRS